MGQYHVIYNKTKKEFYSLGGAKLWEKAHCTPSMMGLLVLLANSNGRGGGDLHNPIYKDDFNPKNPSKRLKKAKYYRWSNEKQKKIDCTQGEYDEIERALDVINGRWAGDEIVIQGDYAETSDPGYIKKENQEDYKNITGLVIKAFEAVMKDESDEDSQELMNIIKSEKQYLRGIL